MKNIFIIFIISISTSLFAQDYSVGFKNINWGTALEEMSDQFTKSENKIPPLKGYDRINEDLKFEDFTAELITYGFKSDKLKGVNILIKDEHLDHLIQTWTERYGDPKITDAGFLKNYEWHMDTFLIAVTHFTKKEGNANTTIGISQK